MRVKKIVGYPGTGKTTKLAELIIEKLDYELGEPDNMMFSSFSRSAATAIHEKLAQHNYSIDQFPYFRTLHSLSAQTLGLSKQNFIEIGDYICFSRDNGLLYETRRLPTLEEIEVFGYPYADGYVHEIGNILFRWWQLLKKRYINEKDIEEGIIRGTLLSEREDRSIFQIYPPQLLLKLYRIWETQKKSLSRYEYDDMLQEVALGNIEFPAHIRYMFIDEAQDLSPLQFAVIQVWQKQCEEIYYAYDPNQAIYFFNQADPEIMINAEGEKHILGKSYRVPRKIWNEAKRIAHIIGDRDIEGVASRDADGLLSLIEYDSVFTLLPKTDAKTFLLFRTNYKRREFLRDCFEQGIIPKGFDEKPTPANDTEFVAFYELLLDLSKKIRPDPLTAREVLLKVPAKYLQRRGLKKELKRGVIADEELSSNFFSFLIPEYRTIAGLKEIIRDPNLNIIAKDLILEVSARSNPIVRNALVGTIFQAKGLDAERVFVFDYKPHPEANLLRDEARLVFVALTRATDEVYVVLPKPDRGARHEMVVSEFLNINGGLP